MDTYNSGEKSQVPCSKPEQERGGVEGSALAKSQRSSHGVQEEEATSLSSAGPFMEDTPFCLVSPREDGQTALLNFGEGVSLQRKLKKLCL